MSLLKRDEPKIPPLLFLEVLLDSHGSVELFEVNLVVVTELLLQLSHVDPVHWNSVASSQTSMFSFPQFLLSFS